MAEQFQSAATRWQDLYSLIHIGQADDEVAREHRRINQQFGMDFEIDGKRVTGLRWSVGPATRMDLGNQYSDRRSAIGKTTIMQLLYLKRLDKLEGQRARDRYMELAAQAWSTLPAAVKLRYIASPWLDPSATTAQPDRWTAMLHAVSWFVRGIGVSCSRFQEPDLFGQVNLSDALDRATIRDRYETDWSKTSISKELKEDLAFYGVAWPPRWFRSILSPDVFLASSLVLQHLADEVESAVAPDSEARSQVALPPASPAQPRYFGPTKAELIKVDGCSASSFRRISKSANVPPSRKGAKGRRFSIDEMERLIAAAPLACPENGLGIATMWSEILEERRSRR